MQVYINDSSLLCNLCCSLLSFFKRKNYQEKPRKKSIIVWHTVLWNPWDKGAKVLADFGDEDYKIMLSVDSAVLEKPIILKPSEEWKGCQELSTVSSSYCSGQLDPQMVLHGFSWSQLGVYKAYFYCTYNLSLRYIRVLVSIILSCMFNKHSDSLHHKICHFSGFQRNISNLWPIIMISRIAVYKMIPISK